MSNTTYNPALDGIQAASADNNPLQVWAIYLLTDNGPIVVGIETDEGEAWGRYLPIRTHHESGYMKDYISGVAVAQVDVTDLVCNRIGDMFFTDRQEVRA